ncbi:hypothetical protein P9711_04910 [Anoxybacillus geothermalis]|nr:hypothetical protein [Anoxybacillus geothermalis]
MNKYELVQYEKKSISKSVLFYLFINMFVYIIFPSGKLFDINIKMLFLISLFAFVFLGIIKKGAEYPKKLINRIIMIFFFLSTYSLFAVINGVAVYSIFSAASAWLATFIPLILFIYLTDSIVGLKEKIVNYLILILVIYSLSKIILFLLQVSNIFDVEVLFLKMYDLFKYSPITYNYGWFFRINTPVDFLIVPSLLLMIFFSNKIGIHFRVKYLIITILTSSLIISFSRFIYFYFVCSILIFYLFSAKFSLRKYNVWIKIILIFGIIIIFMIKYQSIVNIIYERYFGDYAQASDSVRYNLFPILLSSFEKNFLFGNGLGAFIEGYTYFEDNPWNYVLLWLSFLNQFGIIGFIFVLYFFFIPIKFIPIKKGNTILKLPRYFIPTLISYLIFLSSGFFNTFLLTSSISFLYLLYSFMFSYMTLGNRS